MSFKNYYLGLPVNDRESLALQAGTTRGTLNQMVYASKLIELGLADCLVALCQGITLDELPLTDRAKQQDRVRRGVELESSIPDRHKQDLEATGVYEMQLADTPPAQQIHARAAPETVAALGGGV